ncbi:DUF1642 domain-containing protein [Streptococcus oralis]|uniref:DUF1642 domain-containing protein n=1 Tax=Streptococcus oralis TaxID=1303 RepID=A0A7T2ZXD9_STROR|nr:DUF1642 domain-containing protein [Streptococcus oralis]QBX17258.1 hypothetical protein Javan347_0028 [Streptococcus phage Javan347]QPT02240.1 DUF1642 domain-containing protein [Streptococcus oralis]CAK1607833.1 DUF1642 domain-containing protein [Streptococcus oralis subsp. dentisani]
MNKQELIEKINNLQYSLSWNIPRINKETVLELIEQLDEPQKVVVPQFVADWIEEARKACKDVAELFEFDFTNDEVGEWFMQERPFDLVARAWLDGYEVEEERQYTVKIKPTGHFLAINGEGKMFHSLVNKKKFTKEELEESGLSEVFSCSIFEVEEVE